jgi:energy-coupling factor transporter ATP-binding protein EcfA2
MEELEMNGMIIESLHVKNVRLFTELNISFNPKFNFIAGPNGCGKTSALACLAHCFTPGNFEYSRFTGDAEFWADISAAERQYRVGLGRGAIQQDDYRKVSIQQWVAPPSVNGRISIYPSNFIQEIKTSPLFIGAQRNLVYQQIQGIQREKSVDETRNEYSNNNLSFLYGVNQINIKQWIINRYFMIEKDWASQEKKNWEHFIANLPEIAPFGSAFSYVRTGRDFEPVFSLYEKECYLEELSAGYQAVLSIIINIIAWIEGSMEEGNRDVQTASGTVCIDEPDIHLHPEWQLTLRQGLVTLFPNLQFIVTTHSPHLLASAGPGEIIRMPKAYTDERYDLNPDEKAYSGWTTDEILADVMEVESLDNKDYERLVNVAMQACETKDIAALKEAITNLAKVSHPDNTIVTVLQTKLASLELTKDD